MLASCILKLALVTPKNNCCTLMQRRQNIKYTLWYAFPSIRSLLAGNSFCTCKISCEFLTTYSETPFTNKSQQFVSLKFHKIIKESMHAYLKSAMQKTPQWRQLKRAEYSSLTKTLRVPPNLLTTTGEDWKCKYNEEKQLFIRGKKQKRIARSTMSACLPAYCRNVWGTRERRDTN